MEKITITDVLNFTHSSIYYKNYLKISHTLGTIATSETLNSIVGVVRHVDVVV